MHAQFIRALGSPYAHFWLSPYAQFAKNDWFKDSFSPCAHLLSHFVSFLQKKKIQGSLQAGIPKREMGLCELSPFAHKIPVTNLCFWTGIGFNPHACVGIFGSESLNSANNNSYKGTLLFMKNFVNAQKGITDCAEGRFCPTESAWQQSPFMHPFFENTGLCIMSQEKGVIATMTVQIWFLPILESPCIKRD